MAVGVWPPLQGFGDPHQSTLRHIPSAANPNPSFFLSGPLSALLSAIESQCRLQDMDDEVVYYVNRDSAGWVEQHVRRHVYIELKLECTRNRVRNEHRARDDWVCLYCRGSFPSKLRLTDHRCGGCPHGPVNSRGLKWQLPVYPNLKTTKQGKDLKMALQRGDVWENLQDEEVWFTLNPELLDVTKPPPERACSRVGLWRRRWRPWRPNLHHAQIPPLNNRGRPHGAKRQPLPGKNLPLACPLPQPMWTFRMTQAMRLRRPLPLRSLTSVGMLKWMAATAPPFRDDSGDPSIENTVMVGINAHQTLHDLHNPQLVSFGYLRPTPFG